MNILYDYQIFQFQRFGGVSRYFFELITRIARMPNVNVSLFQGFHINAYGLEKEKSDFASFFGLSRPALKAGRVFSVVNRLLFKRFAAKSSADVYHPTYYEDPYPGSRMKRILTVHDMIHELFPEYFPGDHTAERKRQAVMKADHIIAVSEATKRDLVRLLNIPPARVQVVYHGNPLRIAQRSCPREGVPYILFVGGRTGYKNFDRTLGAFAGSSRLSRDFQLACFGGPPLNHKEMKRIRDLGLAGRVTYSFGDDASLASRYTNATALIYPSLYEGFGIPILEAMYYGCPVVCSNTSSLPEIAGEAARLFNPQSLESIMDAMEDVVYSNAKRSALATAGRAQEAKFSWDRCAEETMAIYTA